MRIRTVALLAAAMLLSLGPADTVSAAKPKFERSKPHVNVGTIGPTGAGALTPSGNLALPRR